MDEKKRNSIIHDISHAIYMQRYEQADKWMELLKLADYNQEECILEIRDAVNKVEGRIWELEHPLENK